VVDGFNYLLKVLKRGERDCNKLRDKLELYFFSKGYLCRNTIIASGERTSDPHFTGDGRVEKHLIADIFPKSKNTGYYSDFTRTVILEKDGEIEDMLDAVIDAKNRGISLIKDGVKASNIHNAVCDILEERGYHTLRKKHREGFIHSTGHGVGLEVHEKPSIYNSDEKLKSGMVVTVEPGLYYRKWGGVRVEDTVLVKKNGCEILTKFKNRVDLDE
jgi:Xaa-Pro aminopeptidase